MIHAFLPVARAVIGLSQLKIISFGPRPLNFLACNAPIKQLYNLDVEIEENSELDLFEAYGKHEGDKRIADVIADMDKWGYRVNYMYVPLDPADERRHNEELQRMGIGNEAALVSGPKGNFYPLMKQKILKSWDRVFVPSENMDNNVGTIWEIKPEWIRGVDRYV